MNPPRTSAAARRCCVILLGIVLSTAVAQTVAPVAPTPAQLARYDLNRNGTLEPAEVTAMQAAEGNATTILLNPFEVSTDQDRGYAAGNTLSGGRADTPLKITPNAISVMTKEFLDDFAITDMNDAAAWTISMEPPQGGESGPFGGNRFQASFRGGDAGANFPQRNGALQYFIADSYNSERFEFSRGPSTALFGDGGPGGIQGSSSKRARLNNRATSVSLRADSYGGYRGTLDTSYGGETLAVRLNALHQHTKSFIDGTSNKQNALSVAGTYKLAENTQVRAEYERSAEWNIQYRKTYSEEASFWNRTTVNENNTAIPNQALAGLSQISASNDYLIYNFGTNKLYNYRGFQYQTEGIDYNIPWSGRPDLPTNFIPGIDKEFFLGPADSFADRDLNARALYLEHRFSPDWFLELAYIASDVDPRQVNIGGGQGSDYRIDVNRLLPDGTANPNFGRAYSDTGGQSTQYQQDSVKEYRLNSTYKFAVPTWFDLSQRLSLNTGWRNGIFEIQQKSWRWANNPNQPDLANNANQIRYRMYWDQPRQNIAPVIPPVMPGFTFREVLNNTGSNARRSRKLLYGQLLAQTTFWDEKIALTGTFRRDKIVLNSRQAVSFDSNYEPIIGFGGVAGATGRREVWHNSKSAGVVFYPFPARHRFLAPLGFVANYSSNFQQIPNNVTPIITGEQAPLTQAVTKEWGLRYSMGDKAYLTLNHYETYQNNVLSGWGNAGDFRDIYENLGYADDNAAIGPNGFNFQDISSRKLEGWEVELTANPSRNLTLTMNYAHPIVTTITNSVHRRAFWDQHLAEYQAGAAAQPGQTVNGRVILDPVEIQDAISAIENSFNGFTPGTLNNELERHRINVNARYAFTDGGLRGLAVVAGVRYRGYMKIGSRDPRLKFQVTNPTQQQINESAYDYLWTEPTWFSTVGANYTRRFGKYNWRFQLNIDNLMDDDDPQWRNYSVINAGQLTGQNNGSALTVAGSNPRMQVLNNFRQLDPRKFTFTTTVSF